MVAGKNGLPKKDKLALLFNATGINILNSQQLKSMIKKRKYLPKVVIIAGPCAKVSDSVEEAWALGSKQMKCEDFIKAVENQRCFEECFPLSTKSATSPTGNEVEQAHAILKTLGFRVPCGDMKTNISFEGNVGAESRCKFLH